MRVWVTVHCRYVFKSNNLCVDAFFKNSKSSEPNWSPDSLSQVIMTKTTVRLMDDYQSVNLITIQFHFKEIFEFLKLLETQHFSVHPHILPFWNKEGKTIMLNHNSFYKRNKMCKRMQLCKNLSTLCLQMWTAVFFNAQNKTFMGQHHSVLASDMPVPTPTPIPIPKETHRIPL